MLWTTSAGAVSAEARKMTSLNQARTETFQEGEQRNMINGCGWWRGDPIVVFKDRHAAFEGRCCRIERLVVQSGLSIAIEISVTGRYKAKMAARNMRAVGLGYPCPPPMQPYHFTAPQGATTQPGLGEDGDGGEVHLLPAFQQLKPVEEGRLAVGETIRRKHTSLTLIHLKGAFVEKVVFNFLGVNIKDLTWSTNTKAVTKKAQKNYLKQKLLVSLVPVNHQRHTHTAWYASCSAEDRKALQRVITTAQKTKGCLSPLPGRAAAFPDPGHKGTTRLNLNPHGSDWHGRQQHHLILEPWGLNAVNQDASEMLSLCQQNFLGVQMTAFMSEVSHGLAASQAFHSNAMQRGSNARVSSLLTCSGVKVCMPYILLRVWEMMAGERGPMRASIEETPIVETSEDPKYKQLPRHNAATVPYHMNKGTPRALFKSGCGYNTQTSGPFDITLLNHEHQVLKNPTGGNTFSFNRPKIHIGTKQQGAGERLRGEKTKPKQGAMPGPSLGPIASDTAPVLTLTTVPSVLLNPRLACLLSKDGVAVRHHFGSRILAIDTHTKYKDEEEDRVHLRHFCA
ncbi:unnamed protein product [Menidia menidia]|uniref:(Atlantic silverside) hypothetical protein n=1 Tax=Menidia menidia TaxID=238744 RepID=A0A8S4AJT5_9TELE|nr:unnamed protein product [Menidia menidia]